MKTKRLYSLRRSRQVLRDSNTAYKRAWKLLSENDLQQIEESLEALDNAVLSSNREEASSLAQSTEALISRAIPKSRLRSSFDILFALALAVILATIVRQTWFEPYEIPTGSMRPSYKEKDHLVVSKTAFGINLPLIPEHLYFDPSLLQRTAVIVFRADGLDIHNPNTRYLWLFPSKKRFIKRLIGLPGDTLYFYGGQIYGIDKEGSDIVELRHSPLMQTLHHIPFGQFEGQVSQIPDPSGKFSSLYFSHAHTPIGQIKLYPDGPPRSGGEVFDGSKWVNESKRKFSDNWGMGNYAMTRLISRAQALRSPIKSIKVRAEKHPEQWFLEIHHHPRLSQPLVQSAPGGRPHVTLARESALIPLNDDALNRLWSTLYTSRFEVKGGKTRRYSAEGTLPWSIGPTLSSIPDGTYEFFYGIAYGIGHLGKSYPLDNSHPLTKTNPELLQTLFNYGIEWHKAYSPDRSGAPLLPARYAYYRDGDLYVMGGQVFSKDSATLKQFIAEEQAHSTPFVDLGPPLNADGSINADIIRRYGLKVPEGHVFALGDNHAMSADSRYFGPVPIGNLRGAPSFLFWPWDERKLSLHSPKRPWLTAPNIGAWSLIACLLLSSSYCLYKRRKRPIFKRLSAI